MHVLVNLYKKYKEIINYLIVGGLTTVISLATYWFCTLTFLNPKLNWQMQTANIISWIIAVIFAYITNRKYVFDSKEINKTKEFLKFVSGRIATLILDMIIMWLGVSILHFGDKIIKIISQILIIIANYLISKIFVFKKNNH